MRQGIVLPETPRQRREKAALEEDIRSIPLAGKPLPIRARGFRPSAEAYLVATRGPLPYMLRLREIERQVEDHEERLRTAWRISPRSVTATPPPSTTLACGRTRCRLRRGERASRQAQPVVSRRVATPMDPRSGDYALVNGRDYRLAPLDAEWVLARFPADLESARRTSTCSPPQIQPCFARLRTLPSSSVAPRFPNIGAPCVLGLLGSRRRSRRIYGGKH